ncbi:uncharacterized protein CC84DRAFT_1101011 [Paraphaeosphaeria sporulosa]|uniref:Xylanolytic transcriptional activator regulatory domain-containing protein n=1 Tax=Paraphaeosphaeria sporulosa TaxID=1460663 RepID=A0A177C1A9_9PLEO|nr:uncharacterized protein CC84DRAFT_1101011 [Paraphaeosphaeria sporulosa]OAG01001.1 hypothetical protein CC84DRAFT_1101011 [Paraphaeosphaeria sporulosa]
MNKSWKNSRRDSSRLISAACTTTAPTQKPQRQRVHISDEYEKKIDRIEDRLASIEHVLEALSNKLGNLDIKSEVEHSSQPRSGIAAARSPLSNSEANVATPAFEGETTINRQSEFARELLEQAVGSTPSIGQNAEIKAALSSLQNMVTRQSANPNTITASLTYPFSNKALAEVDHTKLERPPWDLVNEVIDKASVYPTMSFAVVFPFLKMPNMKDIFREAFENTSECSVGRRMLVYGVLTSLFYEFSCYPVVDKRVDSYRGLARICERQMEVAMSQLDLYLPATYENILALLLGSAQAIEMCKPSLCWTMISTAAHLSQNLGYHRYQTMKDDSEEERNAKIHVFWFIYVMDKTLSLRLGRASIIQDWDMSLPYPNIDSDHARFGSLVQQGQKGTELLLYWIKIAQIQGRVYEKLFSPAGFLRPMSERARTATELVDALNKAWTERGEASAFDFAYLEIEHGLARQRMEASTGPKRASECKRFRYVLPTTTHLNINGPDMSYCEVEEIGDIFYHADVVMHYSTCALIQRAVSPDNVSFNNDCLESARAALVAHQRCAAQFNIKGNEDLWSGYIHWAILQAPFTPFIVIFCHSVLHCDPSDLNSLSDFVVSLESCRTISEGADKLYKMCHLFLQVAKLYVEAKRNEAVPVAASRTQPGQNGFFPQETGINLDTMTQFDPYLSALGLMPNAGFPMTGFPAMNPSTNVDTFPPGSFDASMAPSGSGMGPGNPTNVQDWFSGSRYLLNLMEDDIQMPDFNL